MRIICGPDGDKREFNFILPEKYKKIGIFVSGGIDSALLYYIMMKLNHDSGYTHTITPFTILRTEGSRLFAKPVVKYINSLFGISSSAITVVGDNTLPEEEQVKSGVIEVLNTTNVKRVYVGVIQRLPIHMEGWDTIPVKESEHFKAPFLHLNKSHVIDIVFQLKLEKLFEITHSCVIEKGRCNGCNGCKERAWAFTQLIKEDPGIV